MKHLGIFEAKNKLSDLVDQAERGQRIVITRRGRPVAELGPVGAQLSAEQAAEAILRLDWKLGGSVVQLVKEGRRERR